MSILNCLGISSFDVYTDAFLITLIVVRLMLMVRDLFFEYSDNPVLENVTLTISEGQMLHLKGGNGKGKTTLLRILAGLIQPSSGTIQLNSIDKDSQPHQYFQQLIMIGHGLGLSSCLTLRENYRTSLHLDPAVLEKCIRSASLEAFADQWIGLLSAGQKRRAALLRLQLEKKPLWLLDEPFVALDNSAVNHLSSLIKDHLQNQGMVVMTSHQDLPDAFASCQEYIL